MDRAEWLALAERCEMATGPNYALEQDIALAGSFGDSALKPPAITASLDAIVNMIERELPGWSWHAGNTKDGRGYGSVVDPEPTSPSWEEQGYVVDSKAATPALALCVAFCLAMSEKVDGAR